MYRDNYVNQESDAAKALGQGAFPKKETRHVPVLAARIHISRKGHSYILYNNTSLCEGMPGYIYTAAMLASLLNMACVVALLCYLGRYAAGVGCPPS